MGKGARLKIDRRPMVERIIKGAMDNIDPDIERKIIPQGSYVLGKYIPPKLASSLVLPDSAEKMRPFELRVLRLGSGVAAVRPDIRVGDKILMDEMVQPIRIGKWHGYDTSDGTELFLYRADIVPAVLRDLPDEPIIVAEELAGDDDEDDDE